MPAIRYRDGHSGTLIRQVMGKANRLVPIRLHGGGTKELLWLGFICHEGTKFLWEGCHAKMEAWSVTSGDGISDSEWISLGPDRVVLCWRVLYDGVTGPQWGVYGIVDAHGCPVLIDDKKPVPPKTHLAEVCFIDQGKLRSPSTPRKDGAA